MDFCRDSLDFFDPLAFFSESSLAVGGLQIKFQNRSKKRHGPNFFLKKVRTMLFLRAHGFFWGAHGFLKRAKLRVPAPGPSILRRL